MIFYCEIKTLLTDYLDWNQHAKRTNYWVQPLDIADCSTVAYKWTVGAVLASCLSSDVSPAAMLQDYTVFSCTDTDRIP